MSTWPILTGNSNVFRQTYVSGFLDVSGPTTLQQDVTIKGRLVVASITNNNIINTTSYSLIIADDMSLNGRLYIGDGAGVNFLAGNAYMIDVSGSDKQTGTVRIFEEKGTLPTGTTGSLVIQHNDISGVSSILFPSKANLGVDYASIAYYESISGGLSGGSKYNYYGDVSSTTSSALVLNVQRDAFNTLDVSSIDSIILQAAGSIIIDACSNTVGQTIIQPRGGNVGIGKTFPQYPLDIHGIGNMSGLSLNDGSVLVSSMPQMDFSSNYAVNWKAVGTTMPGSALQYNGIALSATGQYQTAVIGNTVAATTGYIYTSYNYGLTWNQSTQTANWAGVAMSGNGQIQTAVVGGTGGITSGSIYVSTDYGKTWAVRGTSQPWSGISMSMNGVFQTAVTNGGGIYISSDSGTTWAQKATVQSWYCVASSANGKYQLAGIGNVSITGTLYISSDYGFTWLNTNTGVTPGAINCHSVTMSATGQYMTAAAFGGAIFTSSNYGVTWVRNTSAPTNINWHGVTMTSNGQYQLAVNNNAGFIYYSKDFGITWVQTGTAQAWRTVAISADGKYMGACVVGGSIFSSVTPFPYLSSSGNIDASGNVTATGNLFITNGTFTGSMYMNGAVLTTSNVFNITNAATSTSTVTGALIISGGAGIGGNVTAALFNATSDYRKKTNVVSLYDTSYNIDNLKPIEYDLSGGSHDMGFLAHEVQEEFPFLVSGEKDGESMQSLNYNGFIAILVKEIQDLKKKNKEFQERLDKAGI